MLAQDPTDCEGEPGVSDQGCDDRRDDPANEDTGQESGHQRPGGKSNSPQVGWAGAEREDAISGNSLETRARRPPAGK